MKKKNPSTNAFPSHRIINLLNNREDCLKITQWVGLISVLNEFESLCEILRLDLCRELGRVECATEHNIVAPLHVLSCISSLLMLETNRFFNGNQLAQLYQLYLDRVTEGYVLDNVASKQLFVCQDLVHSSQYLQMQQLNDLLEERVNDLKISDHMLQKRDLYVQRIRQYCESSTLFSDYVAYGFGSSSTDFCMRNSDFDVTLIPKTDPSKPYQRSELKSILSQFRNIVDTNDFPEQHISSGATMLLKLMGGEVDIDVCIGFKLGVANTRLLQSYSQIDPRLKQLVILLKQWSKQRNPNTDSGGYLSSYAFTLMCIHYFQKQLLLPYLQDLIDHPLICENDIDPDWPFVNNLKKLHDIWTPKDNLLTIAQLFAGFFQYFSNYDFATKTISIRSPNEMLRECTSAKTASGISEAISIEEPFIRTDIGKHAGTPRIILIQVEIRETMQNILNNRFDLIFADQHVTAQFQSHSALKGQLIVDDRNGLAKVVGKDNETVLVSDRNKTCHGDIVKVEVDVNNGGVIVGQVDSKYQKITGLSKGNILQSVDQRFPDGGLSKYGILAFHNCALVLTRRTYPWKQNALMTMQQTNVLGCTMDIHAQVRSVILANYSNNIAQRQLSIGGHPSPIFMIQACHVDISVYISFDCTSVTLYLPDGNSEDLGTAILNRIAIRFHRDHQNNLSLDCMYSTYIPTAEALPLNEVNIAAVQELFSNVSVSNRSFSFDEFGYPYRLRQSNELIDVISEVVNHIRAEGDTYEELMIRQYQTTALQISQIQLSFYLLSRRGVNYPATVESLSVVGLFHLTLNIEELGQQLVFQHIHNLTEVTRLPDSEQVVLLHFSNKDPLQIIVGQTLLVELEVNVNALIPFPVCLVNISSCEQ